MSNGAPSPPSTSRLKLFAGGLAAYLYNRGLGLCPIRLIRRAYLKRYLGRFGAGSGVQLGVKFLNGRKVHLGERNVINFGCLFDGRKYPITTGSDVSIGPEASLLTLGHDPQAPDFADRGGPITIGDRVWIAYRAIILPGVTIGEGAVIAAGAIVVRDIPPYAIAAGSPAKVVGTRNRELTYTLDFDPPLT